MIRYENMAFENQAAILAFKTAQKTIPEEISRYAAETDIITVAGISEIYKKIKDSVLLPVYNFDMI